MIDITNARFEIGKGIRFAPIPSSETIIARPGTNSDDVRNLQISAKRIGQLHLTRRAT